MSRGHALTRSTYALKYLPSALISPSLTYNHDPSNIQLKSIIYFSFCMFGESDTGESPRVASPWEALISTPPSPKYVPKLVPEAEEVSPPPSTFPSPKLTHLHLIGQCRVQTPTPLPFPCPFRPPRHPAQMASPRGRRTGLLRARRRRLWGTRRPQEG